MTADGPKVIEFNCRWGDPEAEVLLPLLENDLLELTEATLDGSLGRHTLRWRSAATVGVGIASEGYPTAPQTGRPIAGIEEAGRQALVFHAGTRREGDQIISAGGRVLIVVGEGDDLTTARECAYAAAALIRLPGGHYRRDIAARELTAAR
jgi:phosphoribosylamine--glycine ligase